MQIVRATAREIRTEEGAICFLEHYAERAEYEISVLSGDPSSAQARVREVRKAIEEIRTDGLDMMKHGQFLDRDFYNSLVFVDPQPGRGLYSFDIGSEAVTAIFHSALLFIFIAVCWLLLPLALPQLF